MDVVGRALVVGIGRFAADGSGGEVPVGASVWSELPFVDEVVPPVVAALNRLGYTTDVHMDIGSAALRVAVAGAIGTARVVYVASHGQASGSNPDRVDVVPADARVGHGTNAAQWVDDAQELGVPTLFLFDLCRAGRAAALPHLVHRSDSPANAWVIAASSGHESAYDGRFSVALAEVFDEIARTGLDTDPARSHVPFSTVARRIRRQVEGMPGTVQSVQSTAMVLAEDEPDLPFFPNPAYDPATARAAGVDPMLRVFLDPSDARHFTDRAGTRFTGRRSQLRLLAPWLDDVEAGGLRVVTGSPGVGKSALLGALACAAHPELVEVAPHVRERLDARDASGCPSVNDRLAAVHARGRTSSEVFASMARQLGMVRASGVSMGTTVCTGLLRERGEVPVVVVDALDEASDPGVLCAELIRLADVRRPDGRAGVRLLVGTRSWPAFAALLDRASAAGGLLDLDTVDRAEIRQDLADHLNARLADLAGYAPPRMRAIRHRLAQAIADRLSPHSDRSAEWGAFLVAEIFTLHLTRVPVPADLDEAGELGRSVPTTLPAVFDLDMACRPDGPGIRAVLSALAPARGEGMPLEVALPLAGLFADVDPERARTFLPDALFYLRAIPDREGTLLYRLFHQALVDHLTRQPTLDSATPTPGDVLDHLLATHTTFDGRIRTWDSAPPYLVRHALAYAEAAGRLDELLVDTEYLVHGDPAVLAPAFLDAKTSGALLARAVYRTSIHDHHHADPATRRRVLALDATRFRAAALALAFADKTEAGTWTAVVRTADPFEYERRDARTERAGAVNAIAYTVRNGRLVAVTGADDHTVRVWDLTTGVLLGHLTGHTGTVNAVACTVLDGDELLAAVTGSDDHTVRVWNLRDGRQLGDPLSGHTGTVNAVACTFVEGRPVAVTGSDDRTVRVWDLGRPGPDAPLGRSGEPLTGHTGSVLVVACTTWNGRPVAVTGSADGDVQAWDLAAEQRIDGFLLPAPPGVFGREVGEPLFVSFAADVALFVRRSPTWSNRLRLNPPTAWDIS
ncbi:hypothetical protein [Embleya sp. NPDC059259]|uniref:hypothetical protein n=1 Tax=unclassified Embleya TaxID=2699296 RepID=UPI0036748546